GRERVNQLLGRQRRVAARGGPALVIPVAARDPAPLRELRREGADSLGELLRRVRVSEVNARKLEAARQKVDVRVVEAGQDERAFGVNDARARARQTPYLFVRADGDDAFADDGHGLGGRLSRVHRADVRV